MAAPYYYIKNEEEFSKALLGIRSPHPYVADGTFTLIKNIPASFDYRTMFPNTLVLLKKNKSISLAIDNLFFLSEAMVFPQFSRREWKPFLVECVEKGILSVVPEQDF